MLVENSNLTIARHEASHLVVASKLPGVEVLDVSIDPAGPFVRTRVRTGGTPDEEIAALKLQAVIALAGVIVDDASASALDQQNAQRYCEQIVGLRHRMADSALPPSYRTEVEDLLAALQDRAALIVSGNLGEIHRLAARLANGEDVLALVQVAA